MKSTRFVVTDAVTDAVTDTTRRRGSFAAGWGYRGRRDRNNQKKELFRPLQITNRLVLGYTRYNVNVVQRFYGSSCMDIIMNLPPGIQPVDSFFHLMVFSMLLMFSASVVTGTDLKSFYIAPRCWNLWWSRFLKMVIIVIISVIIIIWLIVIILGGSVAFLPFCTLTFSLAMVTVGMVYQPPAPQWSG